MFKRLLIALTVTSCSTGHTQQAASPSPLHFDVVSVRESQPGPGGAYTQRYTSDDHNSHLEIVNLHPLEIIRRAFELREFQVEGLQGQPWVIYTIQARSGEDTDAALKAMPDEQARRAKQQMLQKILVERFHLRYHFVTQDRPSYLLLADKEVKLHPSALKPLAPGEPERRNDPTSPSMAFDCGHGRGCTINARGQTMEQLAETFVPYLESPIADRTNLPGLWDFSVQWWSPMMNAHGEPNSISYPQPEEAFPRQLGLKLKRGTAPMQILVVDHIEPPTPN